MTEQMTLTEHRSLLGALQWELTETGERLLAGGQA